MLFAAPLHLFKKMTSQNPTQCHTVSHDLTRCRTMSLNSPNCQLTSHIKSHNISHDVTQYHIVSQIVTKCNILSLCVTKFHTMLQNDTNATKCHEKYLKIHIIRFQSLIQMLITSFNLTISKKFSFPKQTFTFFKIFHFDERCLMSAFLKTFFR